MLLCSVYSFEKWYLCIYSSSISFFVRSFIITIHHVSIICTKEPI